MDESPSLKEMRESTRGLSDRTYYEVLNQLPEPLFLVDDERRCVDANAVACALFGVSRRELPNLRVGDWGPTVPPIDSIWRRFLVHGELDDEFVLLRNGTQARMRIHARANVAPGLHVALLRRVDDGATHGSRGGKEEQLLLRLGEVIAMQQHVLSQESSLENAMSAICARAVALTGAEGATIEMEDGDHLIYRVVAGSMSRFHQFRVQKSSSLSGLAFATQRALRCDDSETDARVDRDACRRVGVRSMVVVPLLHAACVVGVLKVISPRPRAFDEPTSELLQLIAGFLGASMARARANEVQEALERAEAERLRELEQLRVELAALIVHDLKSPLTAVIANLELLREDLPASSAESVDMAMDALIAAHRIDAMLKSLLETAKMEQGHLPIRATDVALGALIDAVFAERMASVRMRSIKLVRHIEPVLNLFADAALLRRVFDNIVDNALRFVPDGGTIEVVADVTDRVEIRIGNSGPPVPPERRERIFEKFSQAVPAGRANFGLGLYFCRLVIEAHGGRISLEPPSGALPVVFVIKLPLAPK